MVADDKRSYLLSSLTPPGVCAAAGSSGRVSKMPVAQAPRTERALRVTLLQPLAGAGSSRARQRFSSLILIALAKCSTSSRRSLVPGFYNEQPRPCDATPTALISGVALCTEPPPNRSCWLSLSRKVETREPH